MAQTTTTIIGNLTEDPYLQHFENSNSFKTRLRVASSRRARDKDNTDTWRDVDLLFIDIDVWGTLAINCRKSLAKGMPVIVHGTLVTDEWKDKEGHPRQAVRLRGYSVGLDLNKYVIASQRIEPSERNLIGAALPADVDPRSLCGRIWPGTEAAPEAVSELGPLPAPRDPVGVGAGDEGASTSGHNGEGTTNPPF